MFVDLTTLLVQLRAERDVLDAAIFNLEFSHRENVKSAGDPRSRRHQLSEQLTFL